MKRQTPEKCVFRKADGSRCRRWPRRGATVCDSHGAAAPQVKAKAALRADVMDTAGWTLAETADVDLVQFALQRIKQAGDRADGYAAEIRRLIAESPDLRDALVGDSYGEGGKTGEYIRGLVRLESEERDRAMRWVFQALAVGVEAKRIAAAQAVGVQIAEVLRPILSDPAVALSDEQRVAFLGALRSHLGLADAPMVIEAGGDR